MSTEQW